MKETAVGYLVEKILINRVTDYEQLVKIFNIASSMEYDQIVEAYETPREFEDGDEYYYKNFKP
jgi:hypothetical protein